MGIISLVVLGIFTVEILLKMIAFGKHFWSHFWHVFDLFVVVVAISVETVEHFLLSKHRIERVEEKNLIFDRFLTNFAPKSKNLLQNRKNFILSKFQKFVLGRRRQSGSRLALCH